MGMEQGEKKEGGECRGEWKVKGVYRRRVIVNTTVDLDTMWFGIFNINIWVRLY